MFRRRGNHGLDYRWRSSPSRGPSIFDSVYHSFDSLETRPLGGVFKRRHPSRERPDDVLHVDGVSEWVTPRYTLPDLIRQLKGIDESLLPKGTTTLDLKHALNWLRVCPVSWSGLPEPAAAEYAS